MKATLTVLSFLVSFLIVLYIVFIVVDIGEFSLVLAKMSPLPFILAMLVYLIENIFASVRLKCVFGRMGRHSSFRSFFWGNQTGMLLSNFTPGRIGYAIGATAYFRFEEKMNASETLGVLSQIQVVELLVKAFAASFSIMFLLTFIRINQVLISAFVSILIVLAVCGVFLLLMSNTNIDCLLNLVPIIGVRFNHYLNKMRTAINEMEGTTTIIIPVTLLNWMFRGLEWFLIAHSVGAVLSFHMYVLLHPMLTIARFTPFTLAGFGVFEGIMIAGLGLFGVPASTALLFALLDRANNALVDLTALLQIRNMLTNRN